MHDKTLLFVYGTLKRGERLHHHLGGSHCLGCARTAAGYALYCIEWYPAMVAESGAAGVNGELFEVDRSVLAELDVVEGVPEIFQRVEIQLVELEGQAVIRRCLTYLYQQPVAERVKIDSGNW